MRANRPADRPAIDATADALPFPDGSFDAAMSTFSVHQWPNLEAGLAELRRVARGPVVIMSIDPGFDQRFWLDEYAPEVMETEAGRFPPIARITDALGGTVEVRTVPIPLDCTDGFNQAFYGRPEVLLERGARVANSAWSFVGEEVEERFVRELGRDLESGAWDARHGFLALAENLIGVAHDHADQQADDRQHRENLHEGEAAIGPGGSSRGSTAISRRPAKKRGRRELRMDHERISAGPGEAEMGCRPPPPGAGEIHRSWPGPPAACCA